MLISIQFLRGIAALMVVITHASHKGNQYNINFFEGYHIGGSGVDLFFIISGFIMCYTTHNKDISAYQFIKNRVQRIIPLYWLLSSLALIAYLIYPSLVNSSGGKTDVLASFFLIPSENKFLIQNGWTLSYEFYYYFIFALFIFITSTNFYRYSSISFMILFLVTIGFIYKPSTPFLSFLTNNLLFEFLLGILAFFIFKNNKLSYGYGLLSFLTGVFLLIFININGDFNLSRSLVYGIPMFFVFIGFVSFESILSQLKNPFFNSLGYLGDSSYSLYLAHPFFLSPTALILNKLGISNMYIFSSSLILGSIIFGYCTYLYIEKPLLSLTKNNSFLRKYINISFHKS